MARNSRSSNSSNYADNGAHQDNVIIYSNVYYSWPAHLKVALEMFARDNPPVEELGPSGTSHVAIKCQHRSECMTDDRSGSQFLGSQVGDRPTKALQHKATRSKAVLSFLKDSGFFDVDIDKCLDRYPSPQHAKPVMDILKDTQVQALSSWIKSKDSTVLLLDRQVDANTNSDWTTDFTLELIGRITHFNNTIGANQRPKTVVTYFCAERPCADKWGQEVLVQDFLIQLCKARHDSLKVNHDCDGLGKTDGIFHKKPTTIFQWWELFHRCVTTAGIETLYVLLDNVDSIQDRCSKPTFQAFIVNLCNFLVVCQGKSVPVKLLVTSRSDDTWAYFQNLNLDLHYIELDYPPHRRHPH